MRQHANAWRDLLQQTVRRSGAISALRGAAVGLVLGSPWLVGGIMMVTRTNEVRSWIASAAYGCVCAGIGALIGWWLGRQSLQQAAALLEQRVPALNNLLVTTEEVERTSSDRRVAPETRALIEQRADRAAAAIDLATALPVTGSLRALGLAGLVFAVAATAGHLRMASAPGPGRSSKPASTDAFGVTGVSVRVTPPAYTRQPVATYNDPASIEALEGSTIRFSVRARADTLRVTTQDSTAALLPGRDGEFTYQAIAAADGFFGLTPGTVGAAAATGRRLIGLAIRPDDAPRVRIVTPTADLLVPDASRSLAIRVQADDDLAIGTLRIKYTKVAGSGERFTFSEGELPLNVTRTSRQAWTARATLALSRLLQEPGDLVVYRAVVTDNRPGSAPVESDALIAELAAPGGVAALGFALDPDEDRYALSQQMVIQKTERLMAQRSTLTPAQLVEQSMQLAGEQRRVRAEFVFMMGGEFSQLATGEDGLMELDEHEEAESEGDLAAGRMENKGRSALLAAVRAMSRAAVSLTTADLTPALAQERRALEQLQEAFARNRFLMRALSQREQIDLTRRLTGVREGIARQTRRVPEGEQSERQRALRALLADLTAAAPDAAANSAQARGENPLLDIAERVLRVDPSLPAAQRIARQLTTANQRRMNGAGTASASQRVLLDSAATGLTALLRPETRPAAAVARSLDARRLEAALDDALGATGAGAASGARTSAPRASTLRPPAR